MMARGKYFQQILFDMGRPPLVLEVQDLATSEDPLEIFLERRGWELKQVKKLQESISKKLTVDMFSGQTDKLSSLEVRLREDIEKFLKGA